MFENNVFFLGARSASVGPRGDRLPPTHGRRLQRPSKALPGQREGSLASDNGGKLASWPSCKELQARMPHRGLRGAPCTCWRSRGAEPAGRGHLVTCGTKVPGLAPVWSHQRPLQTLANCFALCRADGELPSLESGKVQSCPRLLGPPQSQNRLRAERIQKCLFSKLVLKHRLIEMDNRLVVPRGERRGGR